MGLLTITIQTAVVIIGQLRKVHLISSDYAIEVAWQSSYNQTTEIVAFQMKTLRKPFCPCSSHIFLMLKQSLWASWTTAAASSGTSIVSYVK